LLQTRVYRAVANDRLFWPCFPTFQVSCHNI
jgi:hypothetical protein